MYGCIVCSVCGVNACMGALCVVYSYGVLLISSPQTMIVLEYMPQGDLKSYLQKMRPQ